MKWIIFYLLLFTWYGWSFNDYLLTSVLICRWQLGINTYLVLIISFIILPDFLRTNQSHQIPYPWSPIALLLLMVSKSEMEIYPKKTITTTTTTTNLRRDLLLVNIKESWFGCHYSKCMNNWTVRHISPTNII